MVQVQPNLRNLPAQSALAKKHTYVSTTSFLTKPASEPGVVIIKCAPKMSYLKNTPCHLDYLGEFRDENGEPPLAFFPIADFFLKVIFKDSTPIPRLIEHLKEANKLMGSPWFHMARYGDIDHPLQLSLNSKPKIKPNLPEAREKILTRAGYFITLEGIPLYASTDKILQAFAKTQVKVLGSDFIVTVKHVVHLVPAVSQL